MVNATFDDDVETVQVLLRLARTKLEEVDSYYQDPLEKHAKRRAWKKRVKALEQQIETMHRRAGRNEELARG